MACLCLPGIHRAVDRSFRLSSRQTAGRGPVALIDQVRDVVAIRETPCVVRHPTKLLLVDSSRGAAGPDREKLDLLDGDVEA